MPKKKFNNKIYNTKYSAAYLAWKYFYKDKKMDEGAADKSLKKKSEESDISFSILKKVYSRGDFK